MNHVRLATALLLLLPVTAELVPSVFFSAMAAKKADKIKPIPPEPEKIPSKPLPAVPTSPVTTSTVSTFAAPVPGTQPREMRLLVLAATGKEASYQAIVHFLDYLGIPYQSVILGTGNVLPALSTAGKGEYQGIILATGNLAYCDSAGCRSALSDAGWAALDSYAREYGVRTVAWYAFPEPRYGITFIGPEGYSTDVIAANMAFTPASAAVFPYLNRTTPLKVRYAYYYAAAPTPAAGETTTPLLTINGMTVGATHKKADGREYMAFTFDSNPYLTHSLALQYGAFNWVTKGVFLGARKAYFIPQNDDHFLENDLFQFGNPACMPTGFTNDPTSDATDICPTDRMDSGDLKNLVSWQDGWNKRAQFRDFQITMAFNGWGAAKKYGGTSADNDSLTKESISQRNKFFWTNHTYSHEDLDCYEPTPNTGLCQAATYNQSIIEIAANKNVAKAMGLPLDATSMVTPGISGLENSNFLLAAWNQGLRYLAADTSRPEGVPAYPNTGIRSALQPNILLVPRRATSVYYNTSTARVAADGSLPDEYNYFYGPSGIFTLNGQPWYSTTQTWSQIVDRESDALVSYMLRGEIYPVMYHQSNFVRYSGDKTLFTDVVDAAFKKFADISTLPVISLSHSDVGRAMEARMGVIAGKISGVLYPGQQIVLSGTAPATVAITGICKTGCESYGGQAISKVPIKGTSLTVSLP